MRFKEKAEAGLWGEHLCLDVLRWQEGLEVKPNTGPGFELGFGIRFHSGTQSEVVPDLDIMRWPERRREYAEVKTKATFCMWNNAAPSAAISNETMELRTGIDLKCWYNYQWYSQKYHNEPLKILFIHVLPILQLRNHEYVEIEHACGIFFQEITILDSLLKRGAGSCFGKMVYWPVDDLIFFRSAKSLLANRATAQLWDKLNTWALARVRKLTKKEWSDVT